MTPRITCGSLFSGVGGLDRAFDAAGMECRVQVEIDPKAQSVLRRHWPDVKRYGDICEVKGSELESVDVLCGGFPCTDLSVAGKRAGLAGAQSGLFFEFARLIKDVQPQFAVIENVPGLLSSHNGEDFAVLLETLEECGACDIGWRVLDAQFTGVPQRRRRVFVVADFRGQRTGEVLFDPESLCRDLAPRRTTSQEPAETPGGGAGSRGWAPDTDRMTFVPMLSLALNARSERYDGESLTFAVVAAQCHGSIVGPLVGVRRLTPRECERLQGWPDDHTRWDADGEEIADGPRYRIIGNGVATPAAQQITERLAAVISASRQAEAA